jgi:hypothetical protein
VAGEIIKDRTQFDPGIVDAFAAKAGVFRRVLHEFDNGRKSERNKKILSETVVDRSIAQHSNKIELPSFRDICHHEPGAVFNF